MSNIPAQLNARCPKCGHTWAYGQHGGHSCSDRLKQQRDELLAALKEAKSVISSINGAPHHKINRVNDAPVYGQTEEWTRWALDEVLPIVSIAIAKAES